MAMNFLLKRTGTANKRPDPASMAFGEVDINYNSSSGGLFYKDSAGSVVKVGPAEVGATAPNSSPVGTSGNSVGEFWYDTADSALKIWNGTGWVVTGTDGTVTSITAGAGLTGGTITTSGTIALDVSGVTPGAYSYSCVTVDCYGRITAASSGCSPVLLCTVTTKGDLIAATGSATVTALPAGSDGQFLIACSSCASGLTYVTTASGTVPDASTTVKGVVELGTDAEVLAGTDTTRAVVPSALQAKMSDSVACTSSCVIASATAVKCAYDVANAALPTVGGTMTGDITFSGTQTFPVAGIQTATTSRFGVVRLVNSVTSTQCDCCFAATPASVKCAYDLAAAALPRSGGTMSGAITFSGAQTFPIGGIQDATTTQKGVVQIGNNINESLGTISVATGSTTALGVVQVGNNIQVSSGLISVNSASTSGAGVVQLCNDFTSSSSTFAATPLAVKCAYNLACSALPKSGGTMTGALNTLNVCIALNYGIEFVNGSTVLGCISGICDCINLDCSSVAASAKAVCLVNTALSGKLSTTGGTMTGPLTLCTALGSGLCFTGTGMPLLSGFTDDCLLTNSNLGATAKAVACTYTYAATMLPKAGGTMTGDIVFNAGQTFPAAGIQDATTAQKGLVQVGTNISVASGTISVASASTSVPGIVQLNDTTTSTSVTEALTAAQGKSLQDQIDALAVSSNIILGGTFDANTGLVDSVTTQGTTAGLVVGSALPTPAALNEEIFVIVDVQGSNGPNTPDVSHVGDWFLSDGTSWQFLNVGFAPGQATTSSQGVVQLATDAEVQAGTDPSNAVVSSALQSKISDSISTTSSTTIASSTAVKCSYDLANSALPKSAFTAKGQLLAATGNATYCALPVGTNSYVLSANSACAAGMEWVVNTGGVSSLTVCPTLCNLGTSTNPTLCAVPAPAAIGICPSTEFGVVKLVNDVLNCCCNLAASAYAVNNAYNVACLALPKSGGTVTGVVRFTCNGLGCPAYLEFCNGIGTGQIYGISDSYTPGCANVAASTFALASVYDLTLRVSGGTMIGAICFCGAEAGNCSNLTGTTTSLACTSTTTALAASAGCCLQTQVNNRLCLSGGAICGNIIMCAPGGGICFCVGGGCVTGITDSINNPSSILAASSCAVYTAYQYAILGIPKSTVTAKGDLIAGTAASTVTALPVGTDGQVLAACSACAAGLTWVAAGGGGGSGTVTSITAGTGLTGGTITTSGTVALDTACVVQPTAYTEKGTILTASAASTPVALPVGGNGQVLAACSTCTGGLTWTTLPDQTPVGTVAFFAMSTAPTGWTVADGSCVSRTTYSQLFAAIGTTYGAGNGSTTFQLPDLRGRFVRGCNSAATGCDPNRVFGSCQTNGVGPHNHTLCAAVGSNNDSSSQGWTPTGGIFATLRTTDRAGLPGDSRITSAGCNVAMACAGCLIGAETRPDNIAMLPCIKTGNSSALGVDATPTVAGAVLGCTNNLCLNTLLGCNAGASTSATTACSTAIGSCALFNATGLGNTALGQNAGCAITTGTKNVAIGHGVAVASATASCQLAIGFSPTQNWITGDSCQNIRPGAGILSTAGTLGTNGQVLTACANGCGVCWGTVADSTPVGSVAFFAMSTAPTGWLVADGSCVSRSTYSQLFAAVGTTYGTGDGSTTFQLPDMRGRFVRGWNSTASGCDPSRTFGSCQSQALCCHVHGISICGGAAGVPEWANKDATSPVRGYPACGGPALPTNYQRGFTDCVGGSATETRPDNIAMLPCIKAGNSAALGVDATPTVAGAVLGCTNNLIHNTTLGCNAGAAITATTCCLTAVGKNALCLATGNNNTAIGMSAGCTLTTGANNTLIGFNAAPSAVTVSNEITFGNSSISTLRAQVTTITGLSDARDKKLIRDLPVGLDFINGLRPVEFEWNMRDGGKVGVVDTGFIAQDLQEVQEEFNYTLPGLVYESNPNRLEASYGKLLPVLVKAIQELSEKNAELERQVRELGGR